MALETSEEEQIEKIQGFLKDYGWTLALALILALGGNFGYRSWENTQKAQIEAASDAFSDFQAIAREGVDDADRQSAISQGMAFRVDFPDSHYAILAAMQIAKLHFQAGDLEAAESVLRDAADDASETLKPLIQLRLARLLSAMDRPEEGVIALSRDIEWAGYASARHEAEGDLLFQLNRLDEARQAYQLAVNTAGQAAAPGLTMKVEDLTFAETVVDGAEEATASEVLTNVASENSAPETSQPKGSQDDEEAMVNAEDAP